MLLPEERTSRQRSIEGDQLDAKAAATDADWAEQDAADALDFAVYVIYDAQLAVLDALDARAYADDRAKVAGT